MIGGPGVKQNVHILICRGGEMGICVPGGEERKVYPFSFPKERGGSENRRSRRP